MRQSNIQWHLDGGRRALHKNVQNLGEKKNLENKILEFKKTFKSKF